MKEWHLGPHSLDGVTDKRCKYVVEPVEKKVAVDHNADFIFHMGSRPRGRAPNDHMGRPKIWADGKGWVMNEDSIHNDDNQFQLSLINVSSQKGVEVGFNTEQCAGYHKNDSNQYYPIKGELKGTFETGIKKINGKPVKYVKYIHCLTDHGPHDARRDFEHPCQPHMFLDLRATSVTTIKWNPPSLEIMSAWKRALEGDSHKDSMARAARIMEEYLYTWEASSEHIIGILDGNGENRYAMKKVLDDSGIPKCNWPEIITFEKDAEVALANTIMFQEDKFIFTGADHRFKYKSEHNFAGEKYAMVEHLIVKDNRLYTQDMKARTKVFYFDYPGGPIGNQNPVKCKAYMKRVLSKLNNPQLIIGVTLSYRKHRGIEIPDLVPIEGFKNVTSFQHARVKCGIYKRNTLDEEDGVVDDDIGSIGSDSDSSPSLSSGASGSFSTSKASKRIRSATCPMSNKKAKKACIKELRAELTLLDMERTQIIDAIDALEKCI